MEDDLSFFSNGRRPQFFDNVGRPKKWKTTCIFLKIEDNLNFLEDGRWPEFCWKWKMTSKKIIFYQHHSTGNLTNTISKIEMKPKHNKGRYWCTGKVRKVQTHDHHHSQPYTKLKSPKGQLGMKNIFKNQNILPENLLMTEHFKRQ